MDDLVVLMKNIVDNHYQILMNIDYLLIYNANLIDLTMILVFDHHFYHHHYDKMHQDDLYLQYKIEMNNFF